MRAQAERRYPRLLVDGNIDFVSGCGDARDVHKVGKISLLGSTGIAGMVGMYNHASSCDTGIEARVYISLGKYSTKLLNHSLPF